MFRKFQYEFNQFAQAQEFGRDIRLVIGDICPAGGKSSLGPIFAHHGARRKIIDRLCWVTSRIALCTQAEEEFTAPWLRQLIGHDLELKASPGNRLNPDDGTFGYATTFDAVDERLDLHLAYFRKHKTGLVLDEIHHAIRDSQRHRRLAELVKLAPVTLLGSGTFQRHDEQPVAFLDYEQIAHGKAQAVLRNTGTQQVFRYDWRAALSEHAIIPLVFHHVEGSARWRDANGDEQLVDKISRAGEDDVRPAIFTVLHESYALELLSEAVAHFNAYKQQHPLSKFLCIAPRVSLAKRYLAHIKRLGLARCAIATSEDTSDALLNIERLKGNERPHLDGLVTVQMAYEGMNCPAITHTALLTHIRSLPWIYQALSRGTRYNDKAGAWDTQIAHCWCPDDPLMNEIIGIIRAQQAPFMRERMPGTGGGSGNPGPSRIVPMDGLLSSIRASEFETGFAATDREYRKILAAAEHNGVIASPLALKRMIEEYLAANADDDENETEEEPKPPTPSQRRAQYLRWIDAHVQAVAGQAGDQAGNRAHEINSDLMRRFNGKHRQELSEAQLARLWHVDLPRWYPL